MKETDNVRVAVRCRPLNDKEGTQGCKEVVKVSDFQQNLRHRTNFAPTCAHPQQRLSPTLSPQHMHVCVFMHIRMMWGLECYLFKAVY